jgi:hypothetical protein
MSRKSITSDAHRIVAETNGTVRWMSWQLEQIRMKVEALPDPNDVSQCRQEIESIADTISQDNDSAIDFA